MATRANMFTNLYTSSHVIMRLVPLSFWEWIFHPLIVVLTETIRKTLTQATRFIWSYLTLRECVLGGMVDSDIKKASPLSDQAVIKCSLTDYLIWDTVKLFVCLCRRISSPEPAGETGRAVKHKNRLRFDLRRLS